MSDKQQQLRSMGRWLRKHYPTHYPVRMVLRAPSQLENQPGSQYTAESKFIAPGHYNAHGGPLKTGHLIRIVSTASREQIAQAVIDEWAHAIRHEIPVPLRTPDKEHDALWGVIYADIWETWTSGKPQQQE